MNTLTIMYQPIDIPRPELSLLASQAQQGDRDACTRLIRGMVKLYLRIAEKLNVYYDQRDDMVQDAIVFTFEHILPRYQPGRDWLNFVWISVERRMRRYRQLMMGPVSCSSSRAHVTAVTLPERSQGIVEPAMLTEERITPDLGGAIDHHRRLARLNEELSAMTDFERDALLMPSTEVSVENDCTRAWCNFKRHEKIKILRHRMRQA